MNRKILLGSTALVAGGMVAADVAQAADPVRLEIRGYRNEAFGVVGIDNDEQDYNNTNHFSDGEVQFRGSTTLDNGITVGVRVELEAISSNDQVDENYVFLEGGFGRFTLGSDDPAPYTQAVISPNVGIPLNSGWLSNFIPAPSTFQTSSLSTTREISADDNMVTYFSPRFAGFQLGLSYIPDMSNDSGQDRTTAFGDGEGNNSTAPDSDRQHGFGVGVNYTNSFNAIDVEAAIGFQNAPSASETEDFDNNQQTVQQYNAGANIGFGGFTIGGSFALEDSDNGTETEGYTWDAGISYATGPWAVSGTVIRSIAEGALPGLGNDNAGDEDESWVFGGAVRYTLGPGITTSLTVAYADYDAEGTVGGDDGQDDDGKGVVGALYLRVNF